VLKHRPQCELQRGKSRIRCFPGANSPNSALPALAVFRRVDPSLVRARSTNGSKKANNVDTVRASKLDTYFVENH
jgi:hypothetical protein